MWSLLPLVENEIFWAERSDAIHHIFYLLSIIFYL